MINVLKIYQDFRIPFHLAGHKHVRPGWIGTPCPFCTGSVPGFHLGYCFDPTSKYAGRFICWRCGGKKASKVFSKLLSIPEDQIWQKLAKYNNGSISFQETISSDRVRKHIHETCSLPLGSKTLKQSHKEYLRSRNFNPGRLETIWGLHGTGPIGDYCNRIIAPIYFKRELVSYQGRDITGTSTMKYKACQQEKEVRDHKDCLYGLDLIPGNSVVVVEGITDVWRLGIGSVATFGIKYKAAQVALLLDFKNIFILFDPEEQAQEQARKMSQELIGRGRHIEIVKLDSGVDPGDLPDDDAKYLMKDLIRG